VILLCDDRYAPTAQVDSCLACYAGDATNNVTGATACTSCAAGKYSADLATSCGACLAGTYSPVRASSCTKCSGGKYSSSASSVICTACAAGKYASNNSATSCDDCTAGRSQSLTGQTSCTVCEAGTYTSFTGLTSCSTCRAGTFASKRGSINCTDCTLGYYQEETSSSSCLPCESGKYSYNKASQDCTTCTLGYDSPIASSTCDWAASGYYIHSRSGEAMKCPIGASCSGKNELPRPKSGHWVNRDKVKLVTSIETCMRNTCVGGSDGNKSCWIASAPSLNGGSDDGCDSDQLQCAVGSYGPLCGACSVTPKHTHYLFVYVYPHISCFSWGS
jgi:hypothetical protein